MAYLDDLRIIAANRCPNERRPRKRIEPRISRPAHDETIVWSRHAISLDGRPTCEQHSAVSLPDRLGDFAMRGKFVFALLSMFCVSSPAAGSAVASDVDEGQELSRQVAQLPNAAARSKSDGQHKIFLHFRLLELTGKSLVEWRRAFPDVQTDSTLPTAKADQLLRALRAAGGLKMIADPTLVTTIGRKAGMFSGGTFPIPLPSNDDRMKSERREFGVRCSALPTRTNKAGTLLLDIEITCSEPDNHNAVTAAGGQVVPDLTSTHVTVQVALGQDETWIFGGCQRKYEAGLEGTKAVAAENVLVFLVSLHSGDEVGKSAPAASKPSK
jgi:hypothetical protein